VGEVFAGRYELLEPVAMGGMGTVWCVLDRADDQLKAAKILRQSDAASLLRFVREQSMRIDHSHVVTPQSWAGMDDRVLFTMPLVRGGSVSQLLKTYGVLPTRWTALLVDQTLQALEAVHAAGIIHRDVKPANLLLEPTGTRRPHVRLGDFGVAALIDEVRLTRFPGAIGTDGYMAPEQAHGAAPEPQQDLYALGVVGVQMLTGLSPRNQKGVPDGALKPLLESLLQVDSEKRPESASAALDMLRAIGVPGGAPWQQDAEPPEVFNQLTDVPPPSYAPGSQLPSGWGYPSQTGPGSGGSGPSGTPPQVHLSPWAPPPSYQGQPGPGAGQSGPARSVPVPSGPAPSGPASGAPAGRQSGPGSGAPPSGYAPGGYGQGGPSYAASYQQGSPSGQSAQSGQSGPRSGSGAPAAFLSPGGGYAPQATGIATASKMMLWVAIACFVVAVGLAGAAVWLMLA
jgi:serine/threonine-protein kinase